MHESEPVWGVSRQKWEKCPLPNCTYYHMKGEANPPHSFTDIKGYSHPTDAFEAAESAGNKSVEELLTELINAVDRLTQAVLDTKGNVGPVPKVNVRVSEEEVTAQLRRAIKTMDGKHKRPYW